MGGFCVCQTSSPFDGSGLDGQWHFEGVTIITVEQVTDQVGRKHPLVSNFSVSIKKAYHFGIPFFF